MMHFQRVSAAHVSTVNQPGERSRKACSTITPSRWHAEVDSSRFITRLGLGESLDEAATEAEPQLRRSQEPDIHTHTDIHTCMHACTHACVHLYTAQHGAQPMHPHQSCSYTQMKPHLHLHCGENSSRRPVAVCVVRTGSELRMHIVSSPQTNTCSP